MVDEQRMDHRIVDHMIVDHIESALDGQWMSLWSTARCLDPRQLQAQQELRVAHEPCNLCGTL
jgi:predicted ATPase